MTAPRDMDFAPLVDRCWWPLGRLGEAMETLARQSGLCRTALSLGARMPLAVERAAGAELDNWIEWAADRLEIEATEVEIPVPALRDLLAETAPAIVFFAWDGAPGFLALAGGSRRAATLLGPDLKTVRCPPEVLRTALAHDLEAPLWPEVDRLLDLAGSGGKRRGEVRAAVLREWLAETKIAKIYLLRLPASAGIARQFSHQGVWRALSGGLLLFAAIYVAEIFGWVLIGSGALAGRLDFGWLAGWALLLVTMGMMRTAAGALEGRFALTIGRIMKSRLLAGALALAPESVRRSGLGQTVGRIMEAQALEALALNGGLTVLTALLELILVAWLFGKGAAPQTQLLAFGLWLAATLVVSWRFFRRQALWSAERIDMTNELVEAMVGHRTRVAQERPERRDAHEDEALQHYHGASVAMDDAGLKLSLLPSAWLLASLVALLPAFASSSAPTVSSLAISLGAMLLAQRAFADFGGGLSSLGRAVIAWRQVKPIFAAARPEANASFYPLVTTEGDHSGAKPVLDGEGLSFGYPGAERRVISGVDLSIARDDRILLEGPSGGGKSTLAALLTGLETPDSGLLLLNGLDRETLGASWHRLVTMAPQYHENHIFSGTLGFNLLMGRRWPAAEADLAEAEALCRELGLGDLIDRMPGGMNQRIGETGWQLSHGERSRIFLARALLQGAEVTIMDESFAALDPETLELCLRCAQRRTKALIVIAHP